MISKLWREKFIGNRLFFSIFLKDFTKNSEKKCAPNWTQLRFKGGPSLYFSEHRGPSENTTKVAPHFNQNFSILRSNVKSSCNYMNKSSWPSFDMKKRKFFLILKGKSHRLKYRFGEGSVFDLSHMRKQMCQPTSRILTISKFWHEKTQHFFHT